MDSSLLGGELRKWARSTFFYRTSRDAMRNRGLCCRAVSVRPSVHLSVTLVYCIHTTEDIVKLLSRPGSPITLVFDAQRQYPILRKTPSAGAQNKRGWENFALFD